MSCSRITVVLCHTTSRNVQASIQSLCLQSDTKAFAAKNPDKFAILCRCCPMALGLQLFSGWL